MKTIIAGSRTLNDEVKQIDEFLSECHILERITQVVSGAARGIDTCGEQWAASRNIQVESFPADWKKYGRGAGPRRNKQMAHYAEALVLLWDGNSPGSLNMFKEARLAFIPVYDFRISRGIWHYEGKAK